MDFCKGDRVRLLGRPDWGPGKVLKNSCNGKVHVTFEAAGEKLLLLRYAKIFKVTEAKRMSQSASDSRLSTRLSERFNP